MDGTNSFMNNVNNNSNINVNSEIYIAISTYRHFY